jgi:hypothetical protein
LSLPCYPSQRFAAGPHSASPPTRSHPRRCRGLLLNEPAVPLRTSSNSYGSMPLRKCLRGLSQLKTKGQSARLKSSGGAARNRRALAIRSSTARWPLGRHTGVRVRGRARPCARAAVPLRGWHGAGVKSCWPPLWERHMRAHAAPQEPPICPTFSLSLSS